ncbi:MAG: hypothetical protein IK012_08595 [Fibrobacter sp.]|uniref:hypothetical protein n=1 Tax=Fibrobacter sp. TaxID=35828 RepID=UPI0025BA68C6|nr:hypothetical protein [Fibrobacter sp.]MBR4785294.1 hypothetical protein [Fibrobacter sp.]
MPQTVYDVANMLPESFCYTAGYDAVLIVNAKMINEAATALFYNNFLTFNKEMDFRKGPLALPQGTIQKLPPTLRDCLKVRLRCKLLHEPMIQFISQNKVNFATLSAHVRLYVWMMDGLEVKFDADLMLKTKFEFKLNDSNESCVYLPVDASCLDHLDIAIADSKNSVAVKNLQDIFKPALDAYFDTISPIKIPLPSFSGHLPGTLPNAKFTAQVANVTVLEHEKGINQLAVAVNILGNKGGNGSLIRPFAPNSCISVALSENAIQRAFDFYWNNMETHSFSFGGEYAESATSFISKIGFTIQGFLERLESKVLTGGYLEKTVELDKACIFAGGILELRNKPTLCLLPGNKISIRNFRVKLVLKAGLRVLYWRKVYFDPTGWLPDFIPDILLYKEHVNIDYGISTGDFSDIELKHATASLNFDEVTHNFSIKMEGLELAHVIWHDNLIEKLGDKFLTFVLNACSGLIVSWFPKMTITPELKLPMPPASRFPLSVAMDKFKFGDGCMRASLGLHTEGVNAMVNPMPKYVANHNNMEVHRIGCPCVMDVYENHQRGYYSLQKALSAGYDGCKNCLPAYHNLRNRLK